MTQLLDKQCSNNTVDYYNTYNIITILLITFSGASEQNLENIETFYT